MYLECHVEVWCGQRCSWATIAMIYGDQVDHTMSEEKDLVKLSAFREVFRGWGRSIPRTT